MKVDEVQDVPVTGREGAGATSYEEFVRARSGALYRQAYRLTGTAADAEDLVQVTLVKLYVAWSKARRAPSVEAYAHKVLVNAFISGRRPVRFTRERLVESFPEVGVGPGGGAGPDDPDSRLVLWPLVRRLPPRQRAVMVLRYGDDLSEAEIAEVLGMATGTVKSTAAQALKKLRVLMDEAGVER